MNACRVGAGAWFAHGTRGVIGGVSVDNPTYDLRCSGHGPIMLF